MVICIGCGICGECRQVIYYSPEFLSNSCLLFFLEKSVGKGLLSVYGQRKTYFRSLFSTSLSGRELYKGCSQVFLCLLHAFFHMPVKGAVSAEKVTFAV